MANNDKNLLASNILTSMNSKMSPCEDFYEFACGGYIMSKPVPDSDRKASAFTEAKMRLNMEFKGSPPFQSISISRTPRGFFPR